MMMMAMMVMWPTSTNRFQQLITLPAWLAWLAEDLCCGEEGHVLGHQACANTAGRFEILEKNNIGDCFGNNRDHTIHPSWIHTSETRSRSWRRRTSQRLVWYSHSSAIVIVQSIPVGYILPKPISLSTSPESRYHNWFDMSHRTLIAWENRKWPKFPTYHNKSHLD